MTKTKLTRTQMIERLGDWWANEMEDMGIGELRQLAHSLMMENLQRRSTPDLINEVDEIMTTEVELADEDDTDTAWGRTKRAASEDFK